MGRLREGATRRFAVLATAATAALAALGCSSYRPFDSAAYLAELYAKQLGPERAAGVEVPFALDDALRAYVEQRLKPSGSDVQRANDVVHYIFDDIDLEYRETPTRNAVVTFHERKGNCLSFVNLFVGIARQQRLNAFYVEVTDYQTWSHARGMVLSQGHIVGGISSTGSLKIYDFLPDRPKTYRNFKPIDDLTAAAHYFNNLGAEALISGETEEAERFVRLAADLAPHFEKALNNLGVTLSRQGRTEEALAVYRRGLEQAPESEALLVNLVRLHQQRGDRAETARLLGELDRLQVRNPFYFLYKGRAALAEGDPSGALALMAEALRRDSEIADVHVGLVEAYLALGDLERARFHLARALRLDATNRDARRLAEMIAP